MNGLTRCYKMHFYIYITEHIAFGLHCKSKTLMFSYGFVQAVTEKGWTLNFTIWMVVQWHIQGLTGNTTWLLFSIST